MLAKELCFCGNHGGRESILEPDTVTLRSLFASRRLWYCDLLCTLLGGCRLYPGRRQSLMHKNSITSSLPKFRKRHHAPHKIVAGISERVHHLDVVLPRTCLEVRRIACVLRTMSQLAYIHKPVLLLRNIVYGIKSIDTKFSMRI